MKIYIALLRGINVSGHRKIKMADLRCMLDNMGFEDVVTYIQSGNVIFRSSESNTDPLELLIKDGIARTFGFDVPVLVKKFEELNSIFNKNPYTESSDIENKRVYFALLYKKPQAEVTAKLQQEDFPGEHFKITDHCVYLNYSKGAGKAKLTNTMIERKLEVSATSRNFRTMVKLLEISSEL